MHINYNDYNTEQERKDVGAEFRRDMRPPVQLPSVSYADSKLGLTMVRPSLPSVPEPPALDLPSINKYVRQICGNFLRFLTSDDLDV